MSDIQLMQNSFPFLKGNKKPIIVPDIVSPRAIPEVAKKPMRTIANIYSAVQAQALFNPGQPTPPDPANGTNSGPIGNNPGNLTIKGPPAKQVETGTAQSLQMDSGWGRTN